MKTRLIMGLAWFGLAFSSLACATVPEGSTDKLKQDTTQQASSAQADIPEPPVQEPAKKAESPSNTPAKKQASPEGENSQPKQTNSSTMAPTREEAALQVEGNEYFDRGEIKQALSFELQAWQEGMQAALVADDCAYQIELQYLNQGFLDAQVFGNILKDPPGIGLKIQEGARSLVTDWRFEGIVPVPGLTEEELRKDYGDQDPPPFVESRLRSFRSGIASRYREDGFLDVTVAPILVELVENTSNRRLAISVKPGQRYRLGGFVHDLPQDLAAEVELIPALRKVLGTEEINPYFQERWIPQWVRAAQRTLGAAGYLDARVSLTTTKEQDLITARLTIEPGRAVRLGKIRLPKDLAVQDRFVKHHMRLNSGQTLTPDDLDEAVVLLYRTGRFETVRLSLHGKGDVRDLQVTATEQPQIEAFIEPGYGSFERARMRLGWRHHNVNGLGRSVRVEGVLAEKAERVLIGWSDPWTFSPEWVLDATADSSLRKLPAYTGTTTSAGIFGSHRFGEFDRWSTDVGVRVSRIEVSDVRLDLVSDPSLGIEIAEDLSSTNLEWGLSYDSRNHPLLPRNGQQASLTIQHALAASGSATRYTKLQASWSAYKSLSPTQTVSVGLRGAAVLPVGDAPLALGLRLFSGGENTVRSFREDELGLQDASGIPIGGEGRSTLSIEFTQDLGNSNWQAAAFVDVGNVVPSASDLFDVSGLETALGLGVRYVLPIGPLRVDWGFNPEASDFEPNSVLHFSVGMAF